MILYADGRLLLQWQATYLTRQEMCQLLNTINQTGFFEVDLSAYKEHIDQLFYYETPFTRIDVFTWQTREINNVNWDFITKHGVDIPAPVQMVYHLLDNYRPDNMTPYQAEQVVLSISDTPFNPQNPVKWPSEIPSLQSLYDQATVPHNENHRFALLIDPAIRSKIPSSESGHYIQDGVIYQLFTRGLLPYQSVENTVSWGGKFPSSDIPYDGQSMTCHPTDGMLEIPASYVATPIATPTPTPTQTPISTLQPFEFQMPTRKPTPPN